MARNEWDPLAELSSVHHRMNKLFETALARTNFEAPEGIGAWAPEADVFETGDAFVVDLEVPGLDQREIDVRIDEDELVVEGERKMEAGRPAEHFHRVERSYGRFSRRFRLPSTVRREAIKATYRLGVLHVVLPKREDEQPKAIKVDIT